MPNILCYIMSDEGKIMTTIRTATSMYCYSIELIYTLIFRYAFIPHIPVNIQVFGKTDMFAYFAEIIGESL